jgi:hypothetical protein
MSFIYFFPILKGTEEFGTDPHSDSEPHPDPLVRGSGSGSLPKCDESRTLVNSIGSDNQIYSSDITDVSNTAIKISNSSASFCLELMEPMPQR